MGSGEHDEDYAVRMKLAEVMSSAGFQTDRVAIEVLYLLPASFVREYTALWHEALNIGEDGNGERDAEKTRLGKSAGKNTPGKGGRGGSRLNSSTKMEIGSLGGGSGKGRKRGIFAVRSDEKLAEKDAVDRVLRKLARKMRDAGMEKGMSRKCGFNDRGVRMVKKSRGAGAGFGSAEETKLGCGKYLEEDWTYCPWCGFGRR